MATLPSELGLKYLTVDVFTSTKFEGNPLAIVLVPKTRTLTQEEKQRIAFEFNLSETVFIHDPEPTSQDKPNDLIYPINIFTTKAELPFAGHPTVGSGWYLLSEHPEATKITLRTKAGTIPVQREGTAARLRSPINFKIHDPFAHPTVRKAQEQVKAEEYVDDLGNPEVDGVASVVKGMTFILPHLGSLDALSRLHGLTSSVSLPLEHLGEWGTNGFVGVYYYVKLKEEGNRTFLRTRMFNGPREDPATGSAACTLSGYLATKKGQGSWEFVIEQGIEMGRRSIITVFTEVDENGGLVSVDLSGNVTKVMKGEIEA